MSRTSRTSGVSRLLALFALLASVLLAPGPAARAATAATAAADPPSTAITVDGHATGLTFDGIGAESGGGGNSRLLMDYPEPERSRILDYLFKPGYGADLQILKVEIGGDTNSTDGAEPSHEHTRGDLDCNRGYEWWIMEQAKARNPHIKIYGLAWGAPGWIGNGDFWSQDMVDYLMDWLGCAATHHIGVDYLGGWNERGWDKAWYENLHAALRSHGYATTQVVGADSGWDVADDMVADKKFADSIDIVGAHYPCQGDGGPALSCSTTANAKATGKPLWASENGSQDDNTGAPALIRSITRGYLDADMTAYLNWPLIAALYPGMPYETTGLAVANSPWSGAYSLGKSLWATAQVTQFTRPGWRFLDSASGYLGGDRANGSYVSLRSPGGDAFSTIVETTTATADQHLSLATAGGLPHPAALQVRETDVSSAAAPDNFTRLPDLTPGSDGRYSLDLKPGRVYTLTTVGAGGKGTAAGPAAHGLRLPYADSYDQDRTGSEARYLADMQGAFEVRPCTGRGGQCLRQMAPVKPIEWNDDSDAYALLGDRTWKDYTVSTDVRMAGDAPVELWGRAGDQQRPQSHQAGYLYRIDAKGNWSISRSDTDGTITKIVGGTTRAPGLDSWHRIGLTMDGTTLTASVDGRRIAAVDDSAYRSGSVGIGIVGYQTDEFDNLRITPASGAPAPATLAVKADPTTVQRGASTTLTATFAVPAGGPTATGLTLAPDLPTGWKAASGPVRLGTVKPGGTATASWQVTAPTALDTPLDHRLGVVATYGRDAVPHWTTGGTPVTVPIPPPTGDVYVSDLAFPATTNGWGPVERDTSNGEQAAGDGLPLTLAGTVYKKGLGVHAIGDVTVYLGGNCTRFTAVTGIDAEVGNAGDVTFTVRGDGKDLVTTPELVGGGPAQPVSVDVTGVQKLDLMINQVGDNNAHDHGDWADAKLTCASG
ncbi:hypothetical protein BIV57_21645 [Mangrovactinospora gilvigrisea]|uniref:galactosylceramidase n=1 Tax=Mangrovactinospora gilvigrisea TaxID=1428644 RepID=A0A1J7B9W1_9ACTN|nr:NPCBM/NEW2 domain-containing protein [Mangrovactinospora gilvigrisea]OIV35398.1 hypothetical protein BIV57_21645 [Mangrovactinospora gilvigrisea]